MVDDSRDNVLWSADAIVIDTGFAESEQRVTAFPMLLITKRITIRSISVDSAVTIECSASIVELHIKEDVICAICAMKCQAAVILVWVFFAFNDGDAVFGEHSTSSVTHIVDSVVMGVHGG